MLRKLTVGVLICVAFVSGCFAQSSDDPPVPSVKEITKRITRAVKSYANSISCGVEDIEPTDIAALVPWKTFYKQDDAEYAVLWRGDIECFGGSGTTSSYIAIVKIGAFGHFYVVPGRSSPQIEFETLPSREGADRIVGNTQNSLILEGAEYGPNDAMAAPSVRYRFTVRADNKGNWKITEKKAIKTKR